MASGPVRARWRLFAGRPGWGGQWARPREGTRRPPPRAATNRPGRLPEPKGRGAGRPAGGEDMLGSCASRAAQMAGPPPVPQPRRAAAVVSGGSGRRGERGKGPRPRIPHTPGASTDPRGRGPRAAHRCRHPSCMRRRPRLPRRRSPRPRSPAPPPPSPGGPASAAAS